MKRLFAAIVMFLLLLQPVALSNAVTDEALLHLDKPYVYATAGPDTFDCSGFLCYCYKTIEGIELKRSAKDQGYDDSFEKIELIKDLLPGDLVSFNTNLYDRDLCDHSGLYLGKGEFIHCSSAKGKVIISNLTEGYYNERFTWGRRIKEVQDERYDQAWLDR